MFQICWKQSAVDSTANQYLDLQSSISSIQSHRFSNILKFGFQERKKLLALCDLAFHF